MKPPQKQKNLRPAGKLAAAMALMASLCSAQPADTAGNHSASDGSNEHFQRFSALPILGYSEETRLQYGGMVLLFFKPSHDGGKVHEVDIMASGTTRGQFQFLITPYLYLMHDRLNLMLDFRYQNWVASYFGHGNDVDFDRELGYDKERFLFDAQVMSSFGLPQALKYGIKVMVDRSKAEFHECKDEDCEGIEAPEADGSWRNGGGYLLTYDTRDNINWAKSGFFAQWQQLFFSDGLGDYSFDTESLDLRGYTPLFWNISMAVAALWQRSGGDVPFDMLAGPDGTKRFRGVESLYFRDRQGITLQAELRKFLGWRLAGDIFFEGSKVGNHFGELMGNKWHQAVGFGGMLALNLKERLYARGEISLIDYEKIGMTVYIRSAF